MFKFACEALFPCRVRAKSLMVVSQKLSSKENMVITLESIT